MNKYSIVDRASSIMLMGVTCCAIVSANTSTGIRTLNNIASYSIIENSYRTDSTILKNYNVPETKFTVEKEAQNLFGNMREATITEQKSIQDNIDKISVSTGINFWD